MTYSTGNAERDSHIKRGIVECLACHEAATFGNVHEKLSHLPDFDLGEDELIGMVEAMKAAGGGELPEIDQSPNSLKKIEPPRANATEQPSLDTAKTTPRPKITREQSQKRVEAAHAKLGEARVNVRIAQETLARTKTKLAECIMSWQAAADPVSPELRRQREARAMIETSNQTRAQRHNRTAITAKQYVWNRQVNGGNSRGAYSRQQAARVGFRVPGSERHGS
jgi:predicted DNA binding CopG/RHH family protein